MSPTEYGEFLYFSIYESDFGLQSRVASIPSQIASQYKSFKSETIRVNFQKIGRSWIDQKISKHFPEIVFLNETKQFRWFLNFEN